jgi:CheY-like chemotaxis protein
VAVAMLSDLGCVVEETSGGEAAVALLEGGASFDAALVDFAMPGMNGAEAAARMVSLRPSLRVVLMSGYADAETLVEHWTGRLLHKPFDAGALAAELTAARG